MAKLGRTYAALRHLARGHRLGRVPGVRPIDRMARRVAARRSTGEFTIRGKTARPPSRGGAGRVVTAEWWFDSARADHHRSLHRRNYSEHHGHRHRGQRGLLQRHRGLFPRCKRPGCLPSSQILACGPTWNGPPGTAKAPSISCGRRLLPATERSNSTSDRDLPAVRSSANS